MASTNALKLPLPNTFGPFRWMISTRKALAGLFQGFEIIVLLKDILHYPVNQKFPIPSVGSNLHRYAPLLCPAGNHNNIEALKNFKHPTISFLTVFTYRQK